MPFDDDAEADNPGYRPPPHPDDRIWRHPSEMSDHPIVPLGAPSPPPLVDTSSATHRGSEGRRPWGAFVVAGAVGAVLAGGGVVALGIGERVVERPVTERVALSPTSSALGAADTDMLDGVRQRVEPAVVSVEAPAEAGSGVVVRDDGIVITSAALVAAAAVPTVRLSDGRNVTAQLVGTDPATGLAVLDLAGSGYTPSVLAGAADMTVGETTFVLNAQAAEGSSSRAGVVGLTYRFVGPSGTALDGVAVDGDAGADDLTLGGPVVNQRGAVVGIVTTVEDGDAWYVAPVEVAHKVADDLLTDGAVHHCRLGIEGTDVGDADASAAPPSAEGGGTRVASVEPDSPAALGGVEAGDVIVALDGQAIARMPDLLVALRSRSPGDRVDLTVVRADGSRITLVLTLDEAPTPRA